MTTTAETLITFHLNCEVHHACCQVLQIPVEVRLTPVTMAMLLQLARRLSGNEMIMKLHAEQCVTKDTLFYSRWFICYDRTQSEMSLTVLCQMELNRVEVKCWWCLLSTKLRFLYFFCFWMRPDSFLQATCWRRHIHECQYCIYYLTQLPKNIPYYNIWNNIFPAYQRCNYKLTC